MGGEQEPQLNWCIAKHRQAIEILPLKFPEDFDALLGAKQLPRARGGQKRTWLDWDSIAPRYETKYFVEGAEEAIRRGLERSALSKCSHVIMDYGYGGPVIQVEVPTFIQFWDDFADSAEGGAVVVARDENLAMEFSDDAEYTLHSNFEIL